MARLTGNRERSVDGRQDQKGRGTKAPTVPVKAAAATVLCRRPKAAPPSLPTLAWPHSI